MDGLDEIAWRPRPYQGYRPPTRKHRQAGERQAEGSDSGSFAETKDIVGGYTLIEARDLEQAVELSKGCPISRSKVRWKYGQS